MILEVGGCRIVMKKRAICVLMSIAIVGSIVLSACAEQNKSLDITVPSKASTADEIMPAKNENAVEESTNVNGMRFTKTLAQFTESYNQIKTQLNETDLLNFADWQTNGEETTDENGTKIQYYYYNESDTSFTATAEVETGKIVNIGCGTTTSKFMAQEGNFEETNKTLEKVAIMAEAICQFPVGSESFLENVFSMVTTNSSGSVYYQGFVFSMTAQENKSDTKNSIMLFRVFPIDDDLQAEWKLDEYVV